jgi:YVTN family beta-propeller protein
VQDIVTAGADRFSVPDADWLQVIDGAVWTALGEGSVVRLDNASGTPDATVDIGSGGVCTAMDGGFGSLWVGVCSDPAKVVRIDPRTAKISASIRLPGRQLVEEGSVGAGEGAVWAVTEGTGKQLVKIDPTGNNRVKSFPVPAGVVAVRAGLGGVWLTDPLQGTVLRIDPGTGKILAEVPAGAGARFFAVGAGGVWVQNNADGTVTHIDPVTNKVVATIHVDEPIDGGDLAIGGGFVWARVSGSLVAKIDPKTDTVVARYGPAAGSGSVAANDEALWVTAHDINAIYRLPLT